jgi:hypothetical protein
MTQAIEAKPYKLKFKPTPISRLLRYEAPLPMCGNPPVPKFCDWEKYSRKVYAANMAAKRAAIAARALWFWEHTS